jgi:AbrB family looped-hinge helix DNA binding protein
MSYTAASDISGSSFDVVVGTKRQFTIPAELFRQLGLKEGDPLRLTLQGETVQMEPLVSVPRHAISKELLAEMQSRRGMRADDVTLDEFLEFRRKMKSDRKVAEAELLGKERTRTAEAGSSKA